jgi:hypothetical protein
VYSVDNRQKKKRAASCIAKSYRDRIRSRGIAFSCLTLNLTARTTASRLACFFFSSSSYLVYAGFYHLHQQSSSSLSQSVNRNHDLLTYSGYRLAVARFFFTSSTSSRQLRLRRQCQDPVPLCYLSSCPLQSGGFQSPQYESISSQEQACSRWPTFCMRHSFFSHPSSLINSLLSPYATVFIAMARWRCLLPR